MGAHVRVVLTDNKSTLLSQSVKQGVRTVRVHQMFLDGDDDVRAAVAHYLARGDRASGAVVDAFVDRTKHLLELVSKPLPDDAHVGRVHNLLPHFHELNARYFDNSVHAEIGWGLPGSPQRRRRRSITLGSYDSRARRITMHPVLDQPQVPSLCVARVVHHEMLHAVLGDARGPGGRRVVHSKAFRAAEALFVGAVEADGWIHKHLDALLRFRPRRTP